MFDIFKNCSFHQKCSAFHQKTLRNSNISLVRQNKVLRLKVQGTQQNGVANGVRSMDKAPNNSQRLDVPNGFFHLQLPRRRGSSDVKRRVRGGRPWLVGAAKALGRWPKQRGRGGLASVIAVGGGRCGTPLRPGIHVKMHVYRLCQLWGEDGRAGTGNKFELGTLARTKTLKKTESLQ